MAIYFRDRKYKSTIDSSFMLMNGPEPGDTSAWMMGDAVSVLFDIPNEQADEINDSLSEETGVRVCKSMFGKTSTVDVPCVVVKRSHACAWRETGRLQDLGPSITLEAVNGYWEDVLKWIILGQIPTWVSPPEPK